MFRPKGSDEELTERLGHLQESGTRVEDRMNELLESSRKSLDDTKDIRRGVAEVVKRIESDPFLFVGRRNGQ